MEIARYRNTVFDIQQAKLLPISFKNGSSAAMSKPRTRVTRALGPLEAMGHVFFDACGTKLTVGVLVYITSNKPEATRGGCHSVLKRDQFLTRVPREEA